MFYFRAEEISRGYPYEYVVWSRIDMLWLRPHLPPLFLHRNFSSQNDYAEQSQSCFICWAPEGEDHGGVNDRHALLTRRAATVYVGIWASLIAGETLPSTPPFYWNAEMLLSKHLAAAEVQVRRMPPTAVVSCCTRGPSCERGQGSTGLSGRGKACMANPDEWVAVRAAAERAGERPVF